MSEAQDKKRFEELKPFIGEALKAIRRVIGKKKEEIASILSIPTETVSAIETGQCALSFQVFLTFCSALETDVKKILAAAEVVKRETDNS